MISIKDLTKIYKNKKGKEVKALNNISLTFPNKGMIFIVGKSGSGKSTLLNLIGGLDSFDNGEILIDNQSLKSFTDKQLDDFHNYKLGFVFQEFNLLEDYSIKRNLEIVFDLQGKNYSQEQIKQALHDVDLDNYEDKMVNELSGGEKQRVSIARALIKNPDIILCDEPTGNLDDENSEIVFNILKRLSEKSLIIIVSHDSEAAKQYGQRVIRLNNGKIVNDTNSDYVNDINNSNKTYVTKHLPFKSKFYLAFSYFKKRRIRLCFALFFAILCCVFVSVSLSIGFINSNKLLTNYMEKGDITSISFRKKGQYSDGKDNYNININLNDNDVQFFQNRLNCDVDIVYDIFSNSLSNVNSLSSRNPYYSFSTNGFTEIDDAFLNRYHFNLLCGKLPSNDYEIVIPEYLYETFHKYSYTKDNKVTNIEKYEDLIGKELYFSCKENENGYYFTIVGIIDTKFNHQKFDPLKNEEDQNKLYNELNASNELGLHNIIYLNKGFYQRNFGDLYKKYYYLKNRTTCKEYYGEQINSYENSIYLKKLGMYDYQTYTLNDSKNLGENEILLPISFYIKKYDEMVKELENEKENTNEDNETKNLDFFSSLVYTKIVRYVADAYLGLKEQYNDDIFSLDDNFLIMKKYCEYIQNSPINKYDPEHNYFYFANQTILECFEIYDPYEILPDKIGFNDEANFDSTMAFPLIFKTVGYYFDGTIDKTNEYIISDETFDDIMNEFSYKIYTYKYVVVPLDKDYKKDLAKVKLTNRKLDEQISFYRDSEKYKSSSLTYYTSSEYEYAITTSINLLAITSNVCQVLFAVGIVLLISFMNYYFIGVIYDKKKEIGVLRALGMCKKDVVLTFIIELFILIIPIILISAPISSVIISIFNNFLVKRFSLLITIFNFSFLNFIIVSLFIFIILFISLLIPLLRLIKQKPYSLINRND